MKNNVISMAKWLWKNKKLIRNQEHATIIVNLDMKVRQYVEENPSAISKLDEIEQTRKRDREKSIGPRLQAI